MLGGTRRNPQLVSLEVVDLQACLGSFPLWRGRPLSTSTSLTDVVVQVMLNSPTPGSATYTQRPFGVKLAFLAVLGDVFPSSRSYLDCFCWLPFVNVFVKATWELKSPWVCIFFFIRVYQAFPFSQSGQTHKQNSIAESIEQECFMCNFMLFEYYSATDILTGGGPKFCIPLYKTTNVFFNKTPVTQ